MLIVPSEPFMNCPSQKRLMIKWYNFVSCLNFQMDSHKLHSFLEINDFINIG